MLEKPNWNIIIGTDVLARMQHTCAILTQLQIGTTGHHTDFVLRSRLIINLLML